MLHTEFEKLTGLSIDIDQYEVINGMYMCQDNQTKQEFCKSFVAMGLMEHVNYVVRLKKEKFEALSAKAVVEDTLKNVVRANNELLEAQEEDIKALRYEMAGYQGKLQAIELIMKGGAE